MRKSESRGQSQGQDQIIMTHLTWTLKKTWMKSLKKTILDSFFETELKVKYRMNDRFLLLEIYKS